jgi:rRNA maturation protein Nop10
MFCLKSAAYWRPVWYTLSRIRTVTRRPVVVFARAMNCRAMSTVRKITPWQARVMCGNAVALKPRCEEKGLSWAYTISLQLSPCGQDASPEAPMRTPKRLYAQQRWIYQPELLTCPHCGALLVMCNYLAWTD